MTDAAVRVEGLQKVSDVLERETGLKAGTKSLVRRKTREVRAVDGISFDIAPGEIFAAIRWLWRFSLRNHTGASA